MNVIKLIKGSRHYEKNKNIIKALDNINLEFDSGKIYIIMGNSGSGKTTLIQNLGLIDSLTSGNLYINGKDASLLNDFEKSKIRKEEIGFIFQSYYLNPQLNAYENVMLPMYLDETMDNVKRKEKALELLSKVGLEDRVCHFPREMSGGEQQRVAIARALANDPHVILADEPTGNLDKENEVIVLEILKNLKELGKCVIIVTHNKEIIKYADKVIYMEKGRLK